MNQTASAPRAGDVLVLVGTRKGTFLFWSDPRRRSWHRSAHHIGWSTHAVNYDRRTGRLLAATNHAVYGGLVQASDDGGAGWQHVNHGLDFPPEDERRVREVWQVAPGHASRPEELWAGTRQAGLFRSIDGGHNWAPIQALNDHPTTSTWEAGGGGLILHTILPDPHDAQRVFVAVSAGGAYRTDDGGQTWKPINRGTRADFMPDPLPETGQCVHKLVMHPARPEVLFQQNHCGVYRSDDAGSSWIDIADGLPSRFGFPMAVHPHDPQTIYNVPLVSDEQRFVPGGQMAVWRSRDSGSDWQCMSAGLPANAWLSVLRDSLAVDDEEQAGVYVGTTTGQLFYSRDEGDHWETLADYLPPIQAVYAAGGRLMAIVVIPGHLCRMYGARGSEPIEAPDIASAVRELEQRFPGIGERLLEPDGSLRRWINVFVDGQDIRSLDGLATSLAAASEMVIVPAVAGGRFI